MGCRGIHIPGQANCLEHLSAAGQTSYFASLAPGDDLDLRGTRISPLLLQQICNALRDPTSGQPRFGNVRFNSATFTGDATFSLTTFTGSARFRSATFTGDATFSSATFTRSARFRSATFTGNTRFRSATFTGNTRFRSATFTGDAGFDLATFAGNAWFDSAAFTRDAWFDSATFTGDARFDSATFTRNATFSSATFTRNAKFDSATFEGPHHLGPMRCDGDLTFDQTRFTGSQVTLEAAAAFISFRRSSLAGTAALRLRYASVSLSGATFGAPVALQTWPAPFKSSSGVLAEGPLATGSAADVQLLDLEGVDSAQLVLTDVDLRRCRFNGAFHLDQIQVSLGCRFADTPTSWRRRGLVPLRWSRRKTIAEEHHWRALTNGITAQGWTTGPAHPQAELTPGPDDLAGVYQRLRKAFEDAGDEPGAADFYYGEMEMRRNDPLRPRAERWLLWWYWLLSGYGLRASRALGWLLAAMATTVLVLLLVGLPNADPSPQISGTDQAGSVQLSTNTPDPSLTLPLGERFTGARTEKATLVVVNSVVFRSSGQNLTGWGTVVEMLSRIGEPVLLGLAALAVRGRVKR